ncbi:tRNA (adenosine(37)-N6)-threonylcarbamoyltransferase complex ATPase subunit type 1 TsaE [Leptospira gomenensis]|uniref:tRNA threonylcarbamoyladenosine biosynthesis protein TsaE n=1 Tax=Leptospira gomenensis TaxID=2484974 RepID=A0A5F1YPX0_9LEPT|nr:tRNA (adenosine(37)-N6)-threonylcarbamoyltransferase complex ATPase subunit type 1 TsaE [Leptospira gomenensis]TGK28223.1 tRNA (adenosine(37)-N6)-threonylcarbamoyltransferase complex ATPase subunit type 1 TsaE [Leptospira gomenensis]TGK37112.1 tRNA (adenosine(37)-N6)-threonylcarbamoyltransferase complex ATPase subunit type 1 TsaE [Leptospira gomenensis]TGK45895.1 tRNA (adenosine(37)-N6)-threonylcarbamoyltransferase complex ATPase subunit type 1 TsaE [Leptospira gomenensis]TGK59792.1 tRNA (ad
METVFRNLKLEALDKPAEFIASLIRASIDRNLHPVFLFTGSMGSGKTTFTSKLVKKISPNANVNSPTYTLYNEYPIPESEEKFYHFDLYRLRSPLDLEDLGFDEIWGKTGISIIEWWQVACADIEILPLKIEAGFKFESEEERTITFKSYDILSFPDLNRLWSDSEKLLL